MKFYTIWPPSRVSELLILTLRTFCCLNFCPKAKKNMFRKRFRCNETPGHLHPEVSSSNVHNSQTVEGASVSIKRWIDREDVKKEEPSCIAARKVNWCSHSGKLCGGSSELKIDLPYDPAVAQLGIYSKDTDAVKRQNTCNPMFLAAMSTIAKLWKQPWCPSKDEGMKKMWSMYSMEYSSAIRNDKYPPFASTWMELEGIMLSEVSQSEKDKQFMFSLFGEYK